MATSALEVSITVPFVSENTRLVSVLGCQFDNVDRDGQPTVSRSYSPKFQIIKEVVSEKFATIDDVMQYYSHNDNIVWNIKNKNQDLYPGGEHDERITLAEYPASGLECVQVLPKHSNPALTWLNDNRFVYVKYIVRNVEYKARRK
jgi:hypothetical protein